MPEERCGYTWPNDSEITYSAAYQHCCWRETVAGTERCIWHADPETVEKTTEALQEMRVDEEVRKNGTPFGERLDGAELSGLELGDSVSFSSVSLCDVDFSGTNLCEADFSHSLLARTDLSEANLTDADFSTANLAHTDLSGAILEGSRLSPANLSEATLDNANLRNSNLRGADLGGASLQHTTLAASDLSPLPNSGGEDWNTSLNGANLSGANLRTADFSGADLEGVIITEADSVDASFPRANFAEATLSHSDCTGVDLVGADFSGATITDTTLEGAKINESDFNGAELSGLDLRGVSSLEQVNFTNSDVSDTKVRSAQISKATNADFSDVHFFETDFSNGDFTDASFNDASFKSVNLSGGRFDNAYFSGSIEPKSEQVTAPDSPGVGFVDPGSRESVNISDADFTNSTFDGVLMSNVEGRADFSDADLSGCEIYASDLSGSRFHEATARGAEFTQTNLSDAEFHSADLTSVVFVEGCTFDGATFKEAILSYAEMTDCSFPETKFREAVLTGVNCSLADFSGADLGGADLSASIFNDANFSNTILENVDMGGDYLFSIDLAPNHMDLVFVCSEGSEHYYVGATLPDDVPIDIDKVDAVVRHTETDSWREGNSHDHLIFLDPSAEGFYSDNFDIDTVAPENKIGAFADFRDPSIIDESDSLLFHGGIDGFTLEELNSDLVFVSIDQSSQDEGDVCGVNLTELNFHKIDADECEDLTGRTEINGEITHPVRLFDVELSIDRDTQDVLHLVDSDFVDSNCSNVDPAYTVAPRATFDSAVAAYPGEKNADFSHGYFPNTDFTKAELTGVNFAQSELTEASLTEADLEGAKFERANLSEASFIAADCENSSFKNTVLARASLENADLIQANLTGSYLFGTQLNGAMINSQTQLVEAGSIGDASVNHRCRYDTDVPPDGPYQSTNIDKDKFEIKEESPRTIQFRRARSSYRRLEELARQNGFPSLQSTMFKRRQEMRRNLLKEQSRYSEWLFAEAQRRLFVYGESFSRILGISIGIVIAFWLLFLTTGTVQTTGGNAVTLNGLTTEPVLVWETLYHSMLVFFTGGGPLTPTSTTGQLFTAMESISGPILLALLVFVLGRRAAR